MYSEHPLKGGSCRCHSTPRSHSASAAGGFVFIKHTNDRIYFNFMLRRCCAYSLLRFRQRKKHLVRVQERAPLFTKLILQYNNLPAT